MAKTPKQFRLSDETLARLGWLQKHLDLDATAVVTLAVGELCERHRRTRLERGADGWWKLVVSGKPVAKIEGGTVKKLRADRPEVIARLQGGGLPAGEAITSLFLLMAARDDGGEIVLADEWIRAEAELLEAGDG